MSKTMLTKSLDVLRYSQGTKSPVTQMSYMVICYRRGYQITGDMVPRVISLGVPNLRDNGTHV